MLVHNLPGWKTSLWVPWDTGYLIHCQRLGLVIKCSMREIITSLERSLLYYGYQGVWELWPYGHQWLASKKSSQLL